MARIIPAHSGRVSPVDWRFVEERLAGGGVIVYPTETLYGLGCDPRAPQAVARLIAVKGRPPDRPLPLIAASPQAARRVLRVPGGAAGAAWARLTLRFWPGPLTLVAPAVSRLASPVTAGTGRVGVRVSSLGLARRLAQVCGGVIVATSANRSGEVTPATATGVVAVLGKRVDLILDGGRAPGGVPSTVLEITATTARVLRVGAIGEDRLRRELAGLPLTWS